MTSRRIQTIALFCGAISFLPLAGCRIKVPTVAEQQALVERKTFPGTAPAWLYHGASTTPRETTGGYVPTTFHRPLSITDSRTSVYSPDEYAFGALRVQEEKKVKATAGVEADDVSVIDKILQACPSIDEASIRDSLTTIDAAAKLQKNQALIDRCASSADLWVWLGKAYQGSGKLVEAGRCFDKALVLDSANQEALSGQQEVRRAPSPATK